MEEEGPSATVRPHKRLDAWKKSILLAKSVYALTSKFPREEQYGLASQMRRAAVSVASNIAEGAARQTAREFVQFLHVARASLSELDTQLEVMAEVGLAARSPVDLLMDDVSKLISGLLRHAQTHSRPAWGGKGEAR